MKSEERLSIINRALARYLLTNRKACDTAAGIARWWLPSELEVTEIEVLPILERLASRGVLDKFGTADGRWFYRRRRHDPDAEVALERLTGESNELH